MPEPDRSAASSLDPVTRLALDYIARTRRGEHPDPQQYHDQLQAPTERREFDETIRFALSGGDESLWHPQPGSRIGPYHLERELGQGGMGQVFVAQDSRLGRRVAIKFVKPDKVDIPQMRQRLGQEARLQAMCTDARIVKVLDLLEGGPRLGVVTELVDGRTWAALRDALAGRDPRRMRGKDLLGHVGQAEAGAGVAVVRPTASYWDAIASLGRELAQALHAAHRSGVVHRDLAPRNVLLVPGGAPRILDFGLAAEAGQPGVPMGTLPYVPPELLRPPAGGDAQRSCRPQADIYQAGLLMLELLRPGQVFRAGGTDDELPRLDWQAAWTRRVPRDLLAICQRATAREPADRYDSAAALANDLTRFLERRPVAARPASLAWRAGLAAQRHRQWLGPLLVAAVLPVLALWWSGGESRAWTHLDLCLITPQWRATSPLDPVHVGNDLGLAVHPARPSNIWVFVTYGTEDFPPRFARVVSAPAASKELAGRARLEAVPLSLPFETVRDVRPEAADRVGALVFRADREVPWLDRWVQEVATACSNLPDSRPGLPWDQVTDMLKTIPGVPRGEGTGPSGTVLRGLPPAAKSAPAWWQDANQGQLAAVASIHGLVRRIQR